MNRRSPAARLAAALLLAGAAPAFAQTAAPTAELPAAPPQVQPIVTSAAKPVVTTKNGSFEGYDFSHVVEKLATSIDPLEKEMSNSFTVFVTAVTESQALLEEGKTREGVEKASAAVDGVIEVRDKVLGPMWDGQQYLSEQVSWVRTRLAKALAASGKGLSDKRDEKTEAMLNNVALRISRENDPIRKKFLIAHYRTIRDLARIKRMTDELSPDQRKLWMNVLSVLDEASLAHQQVLMGSEVLFAQFEATATRLKEYLTLLETVDGASELLTMVRGLEGSGDEMTRFTSSMTQLQQRLDGFNQAVEGALQQSMFELEAKIDAIQPEDGMSDPGVISVTEDQELLDRIESVNKTR